MFFKQPEAVPPFVGYALRAYYEWACDNDFTPLVQVRLDINKDELSVPPQFAKNKDIVFNISPEACGNMEITDDYVDFNARFSGEVHHIHFPVENVIMAFNRENKFGMPMTLFPHKRIAKAEDKRPKQPTFSKVD